MRAYVSTAIPLLRVEITAIRENGLTADAIGGHVQFASTGCPGKYRRPYIEEGSLKRMVAERLARLTGAPV